MPLPYPTLGKELARREAVCTKCGETKLPTRAYLALLKSQDLPYICQTCRSELPVEPMSIGSLGVVR